MRKFFSEYPLIGIFMGSCIMVLFTGLLVTGGLIFAAGKGISAISKEIGKKPVETTPTYKYLAGDKRSSNKFLSIPISGEILTQDDPSNPLSFLMYGTTYGYTIKERLYKAAEDKDIKGVILEIDSPGGTVTGAKAIYDGVEYYKTKTGKPVIAYISGIGASGAYLAALPATKIYADEGTLIGSIGVLIGPFKQYNKVLAEGDGSSDITTKEGIDTFYISSGEGKTFGNPFEVMSDDVKKGLQEGTDSQYAKFVDLVTKNRPVSDDYVRNTIKAHVYAPDAAKNLKLIDDIKTKDMSYEALANMTGIKDTNFQIVGDQVESFWSWLSSSAKRVGKLYVKDEVCPLCGQQVYLYGSPATYKIAQPTK